MTTTQDTTTPTTVPEVPQEQIIAANASSSSSSSSSAETIAASKARNATSENAATFEAQKLAEPERVGFWTKEEREELDSCHSRTRFVNTTICMICERDQKTVPSLELRSYHYMLYSFAAITNILMYCQDCKKKAEYVRLNELVKSKMIPSEKQLFSLKKKLKIIRTNGSESEGNLHATMTLGWSSTMNEITAWVWMPDILSSKPLALSLLFQANPDLISLPEFKNGLVVPLDHEEMFKLEFPDFYAKVQTSIANLNQRFFPKS